MLNQKKLVVISSDTNEAITCSLSKMGHTSCYIISLDDFLNSVTLFDEINNFWTKIHWTLKHTDFKNNHDTIILSRLFYMPLDIFDDFNIEDREYALAEIRAYLGFAINSFPLLNHSVDDNGHEILHPLPTQWGLIKDFDKTDLVLS